MRLINILKGVWLYFVIFFVLLSLCISDETPINYILCAWGMDIVLVLLSCLMFRSEEEVINALQFKTKKEP